MADQVQLEIVAAFDKAIADMGRLRSEMQLTAGAAATAGKTGGAGAQAMAGGFTQAATNIKAAGRSMTATGQSLTTGLTLPIVGVGALAVKAAVDFESAWTGVTKTVGDGATKQELDRLQESLSSLSEEIPVSTNELFRLAEVGGQFGIPIGQMEEFVKVTADLGVATELTGEQAATGISQLQNIMQSGEGSLTSFGDTLVELGNKGSSTEEQILDMSLRIAGAGKTVGLSEADVLGLAAGFSNLGIRSELGGTAVSRALLNMNSAVKSTTAEGKADLEAFAATAGMSGADFKKAFEEDAAGALQAFILGIGKVNEEGGDVSAVLDEVGLNTAGASSAFLSAAGAGDSLSESIKIANDQWSTGGALAFEAGERYKTTASQMEILKNTATNTARQLGDALMPVFLDIVKIIKEDALPFIRKLVQGFANLSPGMKKGIVMAAGLVAALGPVLLVFGSMATSLGSLMTVFGKLTGIGKVAGDVGGLTKAFGGLKGILLGHPLLLIVGVIAAIIAASPELRELFVDVLVQIGEALKPLVEALMPVFKSLIEALAPIVIALAEALIPIIQALLPILAVLLEALVPILKLVGGLLKWLVETILAPVIGFIAEWIKKIVEFISALFSGDVGGNFKKFWEDIKTFFAGIWEAIGNVVSTVVEAVKGAIETAWNFVKGIFETIWSGIKAFFEGIWNAIVTVVTIQITIIKGVIETVWNAVKTVFETIWNAIKTVFEAVWNAIKTVVTVQLTLIRGAIEVVWGVVKTIFETIWNGIKTVFEAVWEGMKFFVETTINIIKTIIETVWGVVKTIFETVWNAIKGVVETVWNAIKGVIETVIIVIKNLITNTWNAVKKVFETVWNAIKKVVSDVWDNIKSKVDAGVKFIKDIINGVKTTIENIGKWFENAWATVKRVVTDMVDWLRTQMEKVGDFLQNLNPLHRESPSLVDNVLAGIADIRKAYESLDNMRISTPKVTIEATMAKLPDLAMRPRFSPAFPGPLSRLPRPTPLDGPDENGLATAGNISYTINNPKREDTEDSLRRVALRRSYLGANGNEMTASGLPTKRGV